MKRERLKITRREFLIGMGAAGAGFSLGMFLPLAAAAKSGQAGVGTMTSSSGSHRRWTSVFSPAVAPGVTSTCSRPVSSPCISV